MSRRRFNLLLPTLVLLALALSLSACRGPGRRHADLDQKAFNTRALDRLGWTLDDIDATPKQRDAIEKLANELLPDAWALYSRRDKLRDTLTGELLSPRPDGKVVHGTLDSAADDITAFAHKAADKLVDAHAVLKADQRAELLDTWQERADERGEGGRSWMIDAAVDRGLDKLDATDKQAELVLAHKDALEQDIEKLREKREKSRGAVMKQLRSDKPDARVLHDAIDAASTDWRAFAHKAADAALEVAPTLTEAQRATLRELIDRR